MEKGLFLRVFTRIAVKTAFLAVFHVFSSLVNGQNMAMLIPKPNSFLLKSGTFTLTAKTVIVTPAEKNFEVNYLQQFIEKISGFKLKLVQRADLTRDSDYIELENTFTDIYHASDSYTLRITPARISITGYGPPASSGLFYGIQSFIQLLPKEKEKKIFMPAIEINDQPTYQWRGMHLDVCRHFFTKAEVKRYIDLLALYKFNVFHWHLTEDQGWRIEIKKYPKLTEIGAWRKGSQVGPYSAKKFDSKKYGGFYTQEDIKEIVAYATERHITIVPEIEMPGHSLAALAAYPQFSCTGGKFEVAKGWGVFDDVYCPKEETFTFLQDVLDEVCQLFPGKYIHIGGDECPKTRWKTCPNCQTLIKKEGLKDEHELQSYFITRIEKYLNSKGKQIIGWDEILEGGLAPNAAVMSWRGTAGGIAAAKQKHNVVMSPGNPCYFDHYQSKDTKKEPVAIGGYNPLDSVYKYIPTPRELSNEEQKYILGAQANVWTEYITSFKQVEYMAVPRMCALAEALWTKQENKNYDNFLMRLKEHIFILDKMRVQYAKHFLINKTK